MQPHGLDTAKLHARQPPAPLQREPPSFNSAPLPQQLAAHRRLAAALSQEDVAVYANDLFHSAGNSSLGVTSLAASAADQLSWTDPGAANASSDGLAASAGMAQIMQASDGSLVLVSGSNSLMEQQGGELRQRPFSLQSQLSSTGRLQQQQQLQPLAQQQQAILTRLA